MIKIIECRCKNHVYAVPHVSFQKSCPFCGANLSMDETGVALSNGQPCLSEGHFLTELHYFNHELPSFEEEIWAIGTDYSAVKMTWGLKYSSNFDLDKFYKNYLMWIRR